MTCEWTYYEEAWANYFEPACSKGTCLIMPYAPDRCTCGQKVEVKKEGS
tara:strand:- start:1822 stop:1968 length:147 start_codon:yes stop_codon:yes gene_type:complete